MPQKPILVELAATMHFDLSLQPARNTLRFRERTVSSIEIPLRDRNSRNRLTQYSGGFLAIYHLWDFPYSLCMTLNQQTVRRRKTDTLNTQQPLNCCARHCCASPCASVICAGVMRRASSSRIFSASFCASLVECDAARLSHLYART